MKTGYVYGLVCPINQKVFYIGHSTIKPKDRLRCHKTSAKSGGEYPLIKKLSELNDSGLLDELKLEIIVDGVRAGYPYINRAEQIAIEKYSGLGYELLNQRRAYTNYRRTKRELNFFSNEPRDVHFCLKYLNVYDDLYCKKLLSKKINQEYLNKMIVVRDRAFAELKQLENAI